MREGWGRKKRREPEEARGKHRVGEGGMSRRGEEWEERATLRS